MTGSGSWRAAAAALIFVVAAAVSVGCGESTPAVPDAAAEPDRQLTRGTPEQRLAAVAELAKSESPGVAASLLRAAREDRDVRVRTAAIRAAGRPAMLGNPAPLVALLDDSEEQVRLAVVDAMTNYPGDAASDPLQRAMSDPSPVVRLAAISSAGRMADSPTSLLEAVAAKTGEASPLDDRIAAIKALGRVGAGGHGNLLLAAMDDPDPGVRGTAATAVAEAKLDGAGARLAALVREPLGGSTKTAAGSDAASTSVRLAAIDALVKLATTDDSASHEVLALLDDENEAVTDALIDALASGGDTQAEMLRRLVLDDTAALDTRLRVLDLLLDASGLSDSPNPTLDAAGVVPRPDGVAPDRVELDRATYDMLIRLLQGDQPRLQAAVMARVAGKSLAVAGPLTPDEAARTLLAFSRGDDPRARAAAIAGLTTIPAPDGRVVSRLIELLGDASVSEHHAAIARALGRSGDPRAVGPLVAAMQSDASSEVVQDVAVEALSEIGHPAAGAAIVERWRATGNDGLIRVMGEVRAQEAVEPLIERVRRSIRGGRGVSRGEDEMTALGKIGNPQAVDIIIERMRRGDQRYKRHQNYTTQAGLIALGRLGDERAIPLLDEYARHGNPRDGDDGSYTRDLAIEQLALMPQPRAVDSLVAYMADPEFSTAVKQASIAPAILTTGERAKAPLLRLLQRDDFNNEADPGIYAAQLLPMLDVPVVDDLRKIIKTNPPPAVMRRAIVALESTEEPAATDALIELLTADVAEMRAWAALSLGRRGDAAAVTALRERFDDEDAEVSRWARWAVERIERRD